MYSHKAKKSGIFHMKTREAGVTLNLGVRGYNEMGEGDRDSGPMHGHCELLASI